MASGVTVYMDNHHVGLKSTVIALAAICKTIIYDKWSSSTAHDKKSQMDKQLYQRHV